MAVHVSGKSSMDAGRVSRARSWASGLAIFAALGAAAPSLAAITTNLSGGTLTVTCDAADFVTFTVNDDGDVVVTGANVGPAAEISAIVVIGSAQNNPIDLVTVGPTDFVALTSVTIDGGGGDDQIFGSQFNDIIIDRDGGDSFNDGAGDDQYTVFVTSRSATTTYSGGQGNDTLFIVGSNGGETFEIGQSRTDVGALGVQYDGLLDNLVISGRGGNDAFVVATVQDLPIEIDGGNGTDYLALNNNGLVINQSAGRLVGNGVDIRFYNLETTSNCDFNDFSAADCNGNGTPDACEVDTGAADDSDGDGLLDECESDDNGNDNDDDDNGNGNDNDDDNGNGNSNGNSNTNGNDNDDDNGNDNDDDDDNGNGNGNTNDNDDDDDNGNDNDDEPNMPVDCFAMLCGMGVVPMLPFIVVGMCGMKLGRRLRR